MSIPIRLKEMDSCVVSDALESCGLSTAVSGIARVWDCGRIAGPACTVLLRRLEHDEAPVPGPHLGTRAIESSSPGDVVVVAHQGRSDSAGWGGLLSAAAATAGVGGVIVDGACRDVEDAERFGLPLYARSATPLTARGRTVEVGSCLPIDIGGIPVEPGDFVLADRSGLVVVPEQRAKEVLARAEELMTDERDMLANIMRGVPITRVMNRDYETRLGHGTTEPG